MHRKEVPRRIIFVIFSIVLMISSVLAESTYFPSVEEEIVAVEMGSDPCDASFRRIYGPEADCTSTDDFFESDDIEKLLAIQEDHDKAFASGEYSRATEGAIKALEELLQKELDDRTRGEIEAYLALMHREKAAQLVDDPATFADAMSELDYAGELYETASDSFDSAGEIEASNTAEVFAGNTFLAIMELSPGHIEESLKKTEDSYYNVLAKQTEKRDPRVSAAAIGLAQAAIAKGDLDEAMKFLDTAEQFDSSNPYAQQLRKALVKGSTIAALEAIREGYALSTQKNLDAFEDFWGMDSPIMGLVQQGLEMGTGILAKERNDASKALDQLVRTQNNENADMSIALTFMEGLVKRGYTMQDIHSMSNEQRIESLQSMYETLSDRRAREVAFRIGKSFENGDVAKLTRLGDDAHRFFKNNPSFDYTGNMAQSVVDEIKVGRSVYNVQNVVGAVFVVEGVGALLSQSYARAGLSFVTRASTDKALTISFGAGFAEGLLYSQGVVIGSSYAGKAAVAAGAPQWVANDLHGAGEIASNMLTFSPITARVAKWSGGKVPELKLEEKNNYLLGDKTVFEGIRAKNAREKATIERELVNQGWEAVRDPSNADVTLLHPKAEPSVGSGVPARKPEIVLYHGDAPLQIKGEVIVGETTPGDLRNALQRSMSETLKTKPVVIEDNPAVIRIAFESVAQHPHVKRAADVLEGGRASNTLSEKLIALKEARRLIDSNELSLDEFIRRVELGLPRTPLPENLQRVAEEALLLTKELYAMSDKLSPAERQELFALLDHPSITEIDLLYKRILDEGQIIDQKYSNLNTRVEEIQSRSRQLLREMLLKKKDFASERDRLLDELEKEYATRSSLDPSYRERKNRIYLEEEQKTSNLPEQLEADHLRKEWKQLELDRKDIISQIHLRRHQIDLLQERATALDQPDGLSAEAFRTVESQKYIEGAIDLSAGSRVGDPRGLGGSYSGYFSMTLPSGTEMMAFRPLGSEVTQRMSNLLKVHEILRKTPALAQALPQVHGITKDSNGLTYLVVEKLPYRLSKIQEQKRISTGYSSLDPSLKQELNNIFTPKVIRTFEHYDDLNAADPGRLLEIDYMYIDDAQHFRYGYPVRSNEFIQSVINGEIFKIDAQTTQALENILSGADRTPPLSSPLLDVSSTANVPRNLIDLLSNNPQANVLVDGSSMPARTERGTLIVDSSGETSRSGEPVSSASKPVYSTPVPPATGNVISGFITKITGFITARITGFVSFHDLIYGRSKPKEDTRGFIAVCDDEKCMTIPTQIMKEGKTYQLELVPGKEENALSFEYILYSKPKVSDHEEVIS